MKVAVRYFASLREAMGVDSEVAEFDARSTSLQALLDTLTNVGDTHRKAKLLAPGVRIAVNQQLVEGDLQLIDGDEVAFLPPVTGG